MSGLDLRSALGFWWETVGAFARCTRGASVVEFALFSPVLIIALVTSIDLGLAEYQRMTIDHALRAGAQSAMLDPGTLAVRKITESTASRNFAISSGNTLSTADLVLDISRYCTCPEATTTQIACSTTCSGSAATNIYYRLTAGTIYGGMIVPSITLQPSLQVQVR
jgi:pilus assembly protein CpaE